MATSRRGSKYQYITCAHCRRSLEVSRYTAPWPDNGVERDRVHRVFDPLAPQLTVECSCGHFTSLVKKKDEAKA